MAMDMLTSINLGMAGFILACFSALLWPMLPPVIYLPAILLLALLLLYFSINTLVPGILLGIVWMASVGHSYLYWQLPKGKINQAVTVEGKITTPSHTNVKTKARFELKVNTIDGESMLFQPRLRLSWQSPAWPVKAGQEVRLEVKLKPPHGLANLAAFNYQQWLLSRNIAATGYVRESKANRLLVAGYSLRQQQLDAMLELELEHGDWLAALSLGYRGMLQAEDWALLQRTGTAHLIAISGLHLGMVVSVSYLVIVLLLTFLVRVGVIASQPNLHRFALLLTLAAATAYAALSGFALPVTRALLMLVLATLLVLCNRHWRVSQLLLCCVCVFLILFPTSIFGLSFWLSFSAILIIWFTFWRWPARRSGFNPKQALLLMIRLQLSLSLLMLPLVGWQFQLLSLSAPMVNLLAVPLVSFLLVPLCLVGTAMLILDMGWAQLVFSLADRVLDMAINALAVVSATSWTVHWLPLIPPLAWLSLAIAALIAMLPYSRQRCCLSILFALPVTSYALESAASHWRVDVLDVGQGLSVVVSHKQRAIVYDVGARYPSGFNMADAAILPFLQGQGIKQVDMVFISHADNDHSGSLADLLQGIDVTRVYSKGSGCDKGLKLNWQGLDIQGLWPDQSFHGTSNQGSCVIRISDGENTVLLPGDIDKVVEQQLLSEQGDRLAATLLLAPHHGSNTSSSSQFIRKVSPQIVIFSQGHLNRWGFPHPDVAQRYQRQQIKAYKTSQQGQITLFFDKHKSLKLKSFRQDYRPYWYNAVQ